MGEKSKKTEEIKMTSTKKKFSKVYLAVYPAHGVGFIESFESK
jgi:CarD family transcriptional regulator